MIAFSIMISVGEHSLQGLLVNAPDPDHHGTEWLADYLYQKHPSDLAVAAFVLVRPPADQQMQEHYFKSCVLPTLRQRIPSLPVYLLGSQNFAHFLSENLNLVANDPFRGVGREDLLKEIRQQELSMYAVQSNALLRTTGTRYFRAPSMKYCQYFMRVGNIQTSRAAIDSAFFWLLPWLKDCSAIIAESWTISSTAINAARMLSRYDPHRHPRCRVDMLSAYHDSSTLMRSEAEDILRRVLVSPTDKVLLLVSSCMSGNLVNQFKETFHSAGFDESKWRCGALYSLSHLHNVPALCDATRLIGDGNFRYLETLPDGASVIEIDRRTYFPLRIEQSQLDLKRDSARKFLEFFNLYRETELFCVHRNCYEQKGNSSRYLRHHAIDLNVSSILSAEPFTTRFKETLSEILPKLIIVPPHSAGIQMAQVGQAHLKDRGLNVEILTHPDLNFAEADPWKKHLSEFSTEDQILIFDDVSVSGSRLASFAQNLRALNFQGQIHFRVGIARQESEKHWKKVCGQLRSRPIQPNHTILAVHEVVLPNWGNEECPWCHERKLYIDALSSNYSLDETLSKRLAGLSVDEFTEPWVNDIFLAHQDHVFPALAPESLFIKEGSTQAALFAAVSSLLQRMRVGEAVPEMRSPNYPEVSILNWENYLGGRFPEASIRAAVMRAAMASELEASRHEDEMNRFEAAKKAIVDDGLAKPLILELMLQSRLRKLPPLKVEDGLETDLIGRYGASVKFFLSQ